MDEPTIQGEEEAALQEAISWMEILQHPRYEETFGRRFKELLASANIAVLDWRRDGRERDVNTGKVEVLSDLLALPEKYGAVLDFVKEMQAKDARRAAAEASGILEEEEAYDL